MDRGKLTGAAIAIAALLAAAGAGRARAGSAAVEEPKPEAGPAAAQPFRLVPIPKKEHGYAGLASSVVRTKAQLDELLAAVGAQGGWNRRKDFEDALKAAQVDFEKEALVLLPHAETSGSTQVTFAAPVLKDGILTCGVRTGPPGLTADMGYYCLALAVRKADVKEVVLAVGDKEKARLKVSEPAKPAELTAAEAEKVRALIKGLGSEEFQAREKAQAELAGMDLALIKALLEAAAKSPDAEVASRAAQLLTPRPGTLLEPKGVERAAAEAEQEAKDAEASKNHLRQIGIACHLWADDHDNAFPPDLLALFPDYTDNQKIFACPGYAKHAADGVDYAYVVGLTSASRGNAVLIYETLPDKAGKVLALCVDCRVESIKLDDLKKRLKEQAGRKPAAAP